MATKKKKKKNSWGGAREGSGPEPVLSEKSVRWNVWLVPKLMRFLQKVSDKLDLGGRAPALRHILDFEMRRATWKGNKGQ